MRSRPRRTPIRATGRTGSSCSAKASPPRRSSTSSRPRTRAETIASSESSTRQGRAATYTGKECLDWAGGRTGEGYAAQGNILVSGETVDALAETFEQSSGPLAVRLIDCLAAAQAAGGDSRGQQSSALLVVQRDGGYAGMSDTLVELRVEDHELPIEELRRIYTLHDEIFGTTPREKWLDVDDELAAELRERLAKLGYEGELEDAFTQWTGKENLEDRVDGIEQIDPVVLEALRSRT